MVKILLMMNGNTSKGDNSQVKIAPYFSGGSLEGKNLFHFGANSFL